MNRQEFLSNIAHRLGRELEQPASQRTVVGVPEFWADRTLSKDDLVDRFEAHFTALGGELFRFNNSEELCHCLEEMLSDLQPNCVGAWGRSAEWTVDVESVLDHWQAVRWDESTSNQFASVQVGITGSLYAIADTGTIVMKSGMAQGRGAHILPLVHIAVLKSDQLRLRLGEVLQELNLEEAHGNPGIKLPASVHFVSGPSRSSDIENDQSIGVHGPARVVVFLLDE